ncbi:SpaA isopeptide-forming pilin-related protein [Enterococcus asini]|uniref:SpaA isopeptide-forming pilin-related protein n=1 Tax=Enterococcus asini TaxID=57732 RepID=A0AAW8TY16_9ENTE|nr:SpaA isopeptide-forming pilin-related protein [Enterococcus asini]MDT2811158.1 SpaA isopeptide-forming pilin-related protein [Enterococcus asini]
MKRVRKKLFTLSGLFIVLAQVFVMAFSGIAAIAITKDETTKNLFDVNGSSATMAYELVDNDTIKWTVSLKKGAYDSPTRFMVDLVAGESSVVPEQIQSTNQEMVFESNYGDDYIQGGFSEQVTGSMSGETTISFVTTRQISNLVVTPKLVTVPATNEAMTMAAIVTTDSTTDAEAEAQPTVVSEPVNLLENVSTVTFNIPAVEVEEPEENQEENTPVSPEAEGDVEEKTTTPVTEAETENGTETPTNTADNGNVATQGVVTETDQDEVEGFVQEPIVSAQYQGFVSLSGAQLLADPLDPFKYYDSSHADGIYPKHETSQYTDADTSDNIRNYNYGDATKTDAAKETPNIELFDVNGDQLNFQDGYHEYGSAADGRINTKKTVSPTNDPNIFQVQLDTIGDAIKTNEKADIVLVLDRSSSMDTKTGDWRSDTRWEQLQSAVTTFANEILKDNEIVNGIGRIQIGLVGFSTHQDDERRYVDANVASFSTLSNNATSVTKGFTPLASAITGHQLVTDNVPSNSGTPTFFGIDVGLNLLYNDSAGARNNDDVKKIMITITDGEPTYREGENYSSTDLGNATKITDHGNTSLRYTTRQYVRESGTTTNDSTIKFAQTRYTAHTDASFYSVGFHTGGTANSVVTALGPNGAYAANNITSLVTALKNAVASLINTIANATITDPLSEYVELVGNVTGTGLYLNGGGITTTDQSFNQAITLNTTGNQITASNVTLGSDSNGRQGYRITYKVKLKDEFHTGKFYPTNGTTYIANGARGNHYYAVPSIRTAPTPVAVTFNKTNGREALVGAQFRLKNAQNEYDSNVTEADGVVTFTNVLPGAYVLSETQTPDGHITMADMNVIVTRDGKITQEDGETILGTVVNTRKSIDVSLTKLGADGEALSGVTFELQKGNTKLEFSEHPTTAGLYEFKNVSPGIYDLVETEAILGYKSLGKIGTVTIDKYGGVTFTKENDITQEITASSIEGKNGIQISFSPITNSLKPIDINLDKIGPDGEALKGATFELQSQGLTVKKFIESTTSAGLHQLTNVVPGTYDLVETDAPEGYEVLGKIGVLEIDAHGVATFTKVAGSTQTIELARDEGNRVLFTLSSVKNSLKPIDLTLNKVGPDGNALSGATFVLRQGTTDFDFSENADTAGLHELKNVAPGTYEVIETEAPKGYKVLGKIGDLEIDSAGQATFKAVDESEKVLGRTVNGNIKIALPTVTNELKPFDLTVNKEDELGKALVGAEFTLTGPNNYKQVITSTSDDPISEFSFTGLTAGTYTLTETSPPDGYIGLTSDITIEISELGVVAVSGVDEETVLTTDEQNNTISFIVVNKKKVPLPATGGSGTMMFVTISVLALTATGLYFLKRKDQEVA